MSRLRKSEERKAKPQPISLLPAHMDMLQELTFKLRKNRSKVIQELIEKAYKEETQT